MLLTWMAFRGKFPRAEPLHFLDADLGPAWVHFTGSGVKRQVSAWELGVMSKPHVPNRSVRRRAFRLPFLKSARKILKVTEEGRVHSLAELRRFQYMVTSLLRHHDVALWNGQRHGVDIVDIIGTPWLVSIAVPSRLQFDRDLSTRHRANERASRSCIRDHIREHKTTLCERAREDILELDNKFAR